MNSSIKIVVLIFLQQMCMAVAATCATTKRVHCEVKNPIHATFIFTNDSLPNKINRIQTLPSFLAETSALCETKEGIWSINDSHNPSELILLKRSAYDIWRNQGTALLEEHFVIFELGFDNHDWEALETDGEYLYIGDFGNNKGNRKNLRILKIPLDSLRSRMANAGVDVVSIPTDNNPLPNNNQAIIHKAQRINCKNLLGGIISFSYANQKEFSARRLHNFDCEAMVVNEKSIFLLSKNWKNLKCNIYQLPKDEGYYSLKKTGSFNPKFLITDATQANGKIFFCGYGPSGIQYIGSISNSDFDNCKREKINLKPAQIEGIHFDKIANQFIISTEARKTQLQALILIKN